MKTQISTSNVVMASVVTVTIVLTGILYAGKNKTQKNLVNEKIKSEKLISEKIKLDEKIIHIKDRMNSLKGKNAELDNLISEKNKKLQTMEAEIIRLLSANASIPSHKKKIAELKAIQEKLNSDLASYNLLKDENIKLKDLLSASQNESNQLGVNNDILRAIVADNYRVEALKGKRDKLTINARRADKLMISFDLPANITNELNFKIIDTKGNEFSSVTDNTISINTSSNNDYLLASTGNSLGQDVTSRTELVYKPEHKLEKGLYKIKIFKGEKYLGSTQLKLK